MNVLCTPQRSIAFVHRVLFSLFLLVLVSFCSLLLAETAQAQSETFLPAVRDMEVVAGTQVSGGENFTCALTAAGGVVCWGNNQDGQLGDGTFSPRSAPVTVVGLSSGIRQLSAGYGHVCALTEGGGVKCWGQGYDGQLGDGQGRTVPAPVDVSGLTSGVVSIAAGAWHSCAVTAAGAVTCWGWNGSGQLGDATFERRLLPVAVSGATGGFASVSVGYNHTCAIRNDGSMACWGYNGGGALGDGTTTDRNVPVNVQSLGGAAQQAVLGGYFSCALMTTGGVRCWGEGWAGQMGNGTTDMQALPVGIPGMESDVTSLSAGYAHICAVKTGGALYCWGYNATSQIGNGNLVNQLTPYHVSALKEEVMAVGAGKFGTCAIVERSRVLCWGDNRYGQSSTDEPTHEPLPVPVSSVAGGVRSIVSSDTHNCLLTDGGGAKCWGWNDYGQLGNDTNNRTLIPYDVYGLTSGVKQIEVGYYMSCALMEAGNVKCWGAQRYSAVGAEHDLYVPTDVPTLSSGIQQIALGRFHGCALTVKGEVYCWGSNTYGQLGDGANEFQLHPVKVKDLRNVRSIAAGRNRACAITQSGGVKCWGWNRNGELGDGTEEDRNTPVSVNGMESGASRIFMGGYHSCVIVETGALMCWGANWDGQLGIGNESQQNAPQTVPGMESGVESVSLGGTHSCAVQWGTAKCWGWNHLGQVGDETTTSQSSPTAVHGLDGGVRAISAADTYSCAATAAGGAMCWGDNSSGLLGNGKTTNVVAPAGIKMFP